MADRRRFIIGFGENLTQAVTVARGGQTPVPPYDLATARDRVGAAVAEISRQADLLPDGACPGDEVVAAITLHPRFLAKSYYPDRLLADAQFEAVGSRPVEVVPEQIGRRQSNGGETIESRVPGDEPLPSTEIFVATTRANLRRWGQHLADGSELSDGEADLVKLEQLRLPTPTSRLRVEAGPNEEVAVEVVLHSNRPDIVEAFRVYSASAGVEIDITRRLDVAGASFIPLMATGGALERLAAFSFLRTARAIPRLRDLTVESVARSSDARALLLPDGPPVDPNLRVAVFDGGVPRDSCLEPWVESYEFKDLGSESSKLLDHGQAVTSALLFGSIDPDRETPRPFAFVDHYRVLDDTSGTSDPFELYDVLRRIESVLRTKRYQFFSLSIGPDIPIEDDEIHSWTSVLDSALADGDMLGTVAVGNNGDLDRESGIARVEPPSDCVNAMAVGSANRAGTDWTRAPYSAVGPGRSPGLVKPDVLAFGGSAAEPFVFADSDSITSYTQGTSFASPSVLRLGLGVRATFGSRVSPLAIKALLVHTAESHPELDIAECGWGRVAPELGRIITCSDGEARVLYEGELTPAKFIRARIPVPPGLPNGRIRLAATLCFASEVDPQDPGNYTRSGLGITFRPHADRIPQDSKTGLAETKSFFGQSDFSPERDLRLDAHKWETVLNASKQMLTKSVNEPVFDIHYNAREAGHAYRLAPKIRYAMVITVTMRKLPALYEEVLAHYPIELQALVPVIDIPIDVET
jgi:Subtilase family